MPAARGQRPGMRVHPGTTGRGRLTTTNRNGESAASNPGRTSMQAAHRPTLGRDRARRLGSVTTWGATTRRTGPPWGRARRRRRTTHETPSQAAHGPTLGRDRAHRLGIATSLQPRGSQTRRRNADSAPWWSHGSKGRRGRSTPRRARATADARRTVPLWGRARRRRRTTHETPTAQEPCRKATTWGVASSLQPR